MFDFAQCVSTPRRAGGLWHITCTDPVLGDSVTKSFSSFALAMTARDNFVTGLSTHERVSRELGGKAGEHAAPGTFEILEKPAKRSTQAGSKRGKRYFDLNSVADVLLDHGLDPSVELARILKPEQKRDNVGQPLYGPDGKPVMIDQLAAPERARVLLELQQYVHPKLKAIEITQKTVEPTPEEVRAEIQRLVDKAKAGGSRD
jgi:hypothetical protein